MTTLDELGRAADVEWRRFDLAQQVGHWLDVQVLLYDRWLRALAAYGAEARRLERVQPERCSRCGQTLHGGDEERETGMCGSCLWSEEMEFLEEGYQHDLALIRAAGVTTTGAGEE